MQHGVEGPGEVIGKGAAGVTFRHWNQAGQEQEEQQQELKREGSTQGPVEEGSRGRRFPLLSAKHIIFSARRHEIQTTLSALLLTFEWRSLSLNLQPPEKHFDTGRL